MDRAQVLVKTAAVEGECKDSRQTDLALVVRSPAQHCGSEVGPGGAEVVGAGLEVGPLLARGLGGLSHSHQGGEVHSARTIFSSIIRSSSSCSSIVINIGIVTATLLNPALCKPC